MPASGLEKFAEMFSSPATFQCAWDIRTKGASALADGVRFEDLYDWKESHRLPSLIPGEFVSWRKIVESLNPGQRTRMQACIGDAYRTCDNRPNYRIDTVSRIRELEIEVLRGRGLGYRTIAFLKILFLPDP